MDATTKTGAATPLEAWEYDPLKADLMARGEAAASAISAQAGAAAAAPGTNKSAGGG